MSAATSLVRAQLERQLQAVVGILDDGDLDALLTLAVERFVSPTPTLPAGDRLAPVGGNASGVALSAADAVARVAAKRDRSRDDYSRPRSTH